MALSEVGQPLKVHDAAFKSRNCETYGTARINLKKGIIRAKHIYTYQMEDHLRNNRDPRHMW